MDYSSIFIDNYRNNVFGKDNRPYLMGIAISWIFFFHFYCWFKGNLPWWIYFFSEGQTGVDIFLFLSAYGLEASFRKNGWSIFYKNRAKRILPVYFLFLITLFGVFQNKVSVNRIISQCIAQLTGYSLLKSPDYFSTNFEFDWFTPALILFYVLFPLISIVLNYLVKKNNIYEILILIILIVFSLYALRSIQLPIKGFFYRFPIFIMGAATYIHLENQEYEKILKLYLIAFIGGLFSNQHWFLTSTSVPVILTVYSMINVHPFYKLFSLLGRHSYEIYLAHIFPVTNFLMLKPIDNIYVYIVITIVWTIILATIYSYFQKYANIVLTSI